MARRAKQGGRQAGKDATGKFAKSAGSQLRRYNEVRPACKSHRCRVPMGARLLAIQQCLCASREARRFFHQVLNCSQAAHDVSVSRRPE